MNQDITVYSIRGNSHTVKLNVCPSCAKDPKMYNKYECEMCWRSTFAGNLTGYTRMCLKCSRSHDICQLCGKSLGNCSQVTIESLMEKEKNSLEVR